MQYERSNYHKELIKVKKQYNKNFELLYNAYMRNDKVRHKNYLKKERRLHFEENLLLKVVSVI